MPALPYPPPEMRALVGPTDEASFDNPKGERVYPYLPAEQYRSVFDFGCGCGRVARQLILQSPRPGRYLGVDLHRGMIEWARTNLTPAAAEFEFVHHNVYNRSFNPGEGLPEMAPLPAADASFTLVNALSVFTHLTERQAVHYMKEAARILEPGGLIHASFFLIDKTQFPMMMEYSNALYLSYEDPSAAVLDDREWVCTMAADAQLTLVGVIPPVVRNHQWVLMFGHSRSGLEPVPFPKDEAPVDKVVTPPMPADAHLIGLSGQPGRSGQLGPRQTLETNADLHDSGP
jgi:SAM-dependent methyltransferase